MKHGMTLSGHTGRDLTEQAAMRMLFRLLTGLALLSMLGSPAFAASHFWTVYQQAEGLPDSDVAALAVDPGGYVWLATGAAMAGAGGDVFVLDPSGLFIHQYESAHDLGSARVNGFAFEHVPPASLDNASVGALWMATNQGLSVLDRKGALTSLTAQNSPLPGNHIAAIFISSENTKWVAVPGRGVCCIDARFNWASYAPAQGLCSSDILTIQEDRNGAIWLGSRDRGACSLGKDGSWRRITSANSGLISNEVRQIVAEPAGRLWFVTPGGLSVLSGQNWTSYTARNSPLGEFRPTSLAIDGSGNKWIGTEGGGLFKLDAFGMWTSFRRENSALPDNSIAAVAADGLGTVWAVTSAGLCAIAVAPRAERSAPPTALDSGTDAQFDQGLVWENIGDSAVRSEVSFALPAPLHGAAAWLYGAVWFDQDFNFGRLEYSIAGNRRGNQRLSLSGHFEQAQFLVCGGQRRAPDEPAPDRRMSYPFPASYPEELREYVLPGEHLPSNHPEVLALVQSLVRPESKMDMYQTILDIFSSGLIQNLGLEERPIGLVRKQEPGEEDAAVSAVQDVSAVLEHRRGDQHAKARLLCTLARAAGIPARLVMNVQGAVWTQVWLAGLGWVAADVTHPVYDYVRPWRTCLPRPLRAEDCGISAISGRDDDVGLVLWPPSVKAYYAAVHPQDLKSAGQLAAAQLLLLKICAQDGAPPQARMPIDERITVFAQQQEQHVALIFQDSSGRELQRTALSLDGLACSLNVSGRFYWKCIPRKIGDILIIENLEYHTAQPGGNAAAAAER